MSKYAVFSGPYFPVFGMNTEIYAVNHHFHSEYRKVRTRKNSVFGRFSRSVNHIFRTFFFFHYNMVKIRSASRIIFDYNILGDSQKYMLPILVACPFTNFSDCKFKWKIRPCFERLCFDMIFPRKQLPV